MGKISHSRWSLRLRTGKVKIRRTRSNTNPEPMLVTQQQRTWIHSLLRTKRSSQSRKLSLRSRRRLLLLRLLLLLLRRRVRWLQWKAKQRCSKRNTRRVHEDTKKIEKAGTQGKAAGVDNLIKLHSTIQFSELCLCQQAEYFCLHVQLSK